MLYRKHLFPITELDYFCSSVSFQVIDAQYFLCIIVVFVLAYGVGRYAILNPDGNNSVSTIAEIIMIPYFQLFGELFLDYPQDSRKFNESMLVLAFS